MSDTKTDHYAEAEKLLAKAAELHNQYHQTPERLDAKSQRLIELAEAHIKLAQVDVARAKVAAIRERTNAATDDGALVRA